MIGETGGSQGSVQWDGRIKLEAALIFSQTRGRGSLGLGFWLALRVAFSVASWQQDWCHALKRARDCVLSSLRWLIRALNSCNFSSFLIILYLWKWWSYNLKKMLLHIFKLLKLPLWQTLFDIFHLCLNLPHRD